MEKVRGAREGPAPADPIALSANGRDGVRPTQESQGISQTALAGGFCWTGKGKWGKRKGMNAKFKRIVWIVNTLGFVGFLAWLASMSDRQILREQDGILYFLPCVPFLFVFVLLLEPKGKGKSGGREADKAEPGEGKDEG